MSSRTRFFVSALTGLCLVSVGCVPTQGGPGIAKPGDNAVGTSLFAKDLAPDGPAVGVIPRPPEPQPTISPRETPVEFFVDNQSPAASDDNAGDAAKPFATITRGLRDLKPGDTLTVRGGTYREGVSLNIVASAEHPVLVRAAPGQTAVIKGSEVVKGWKKDGDFWTKDGWTDPYVAKNFAKGTTLLRANVMEVYQKDGVRGDAVVLYRVRTPQELREGKCFWDEKTGVITICPFQTAGAPPFDPNASGVEVAVRGAGLSVTGRYVTVRGFELRQFGIAACANWPCSGLSGWHNTMEDCVITWSDFGGLSISGFHTVLRRCEASYCGNNGMGGGNGEEMLIEDCTFTNNNFWRYNPGWHAGGVKLIPSFNHSVIRGCRFSNNYAIGLWFDCSCNDNIVENCVSNDNEGDGIGMEISRGNIIRNNICCNNRKTLPGLDLDPNAGKTCPVDCQILRVEGGGGGAGIVISSSPYSKVYNNLCYRNEGAGIDVEGPRRDSDDAADYAHYASRRVLVSSHDVDVRNNLLVNNGDYQLSLAKSGRDKDTFNNTSDYNLFYSASAMPLVRWGFGGDLYASLEKWQQASGLDAHSVNGPPTFEFSPRMDLRLQSDSLGVDQGQSLADVPIDMLGRKRPAGPAADIGPYEIAGTRRILEKPKMPEIGSYFQVDLSGVVNRPFDDEVADDGKGGWTDQGSRCDLRMFPRGMQTFNGVPFKILSPKGCCVLQCGSRPQSKDLPLHVTIPVHRRADMLVFLHSGAWMGAGEQWSYVVHRADGTTEVLKVVGYENIRDWSDPNADRPFPLEYPTTTRVAWCGSNPTFKKVSVYAMTWVNTSTWCDVTEVEMISANNGVPVLIAVTGCVKK